MPVIFISESKCSDDDSIPKTYERDLVAKLVFLVFLTLTDAENVGLMERIYLMTIKVFAIDKFLTKL